MTVAATDAKAGPYTGNDVASSFVFGFKVFADADIRVVEKLISTSVETDLVLTTNYTVTRNADQDNNPGGTVTYKVGGVTTALPSTKTLTIVGDFDFAQPTDIPNGGSFFAQVIENAIDRVTLLVKQMKERYDRSLKIPVSVSGVSTDLPAPQANSIPGWNAAGTALINYIVQVGTSLVDLAASAGSSLIGHMPAGTGAVATDVKKVLNRTRISIFDYLTEAEIADAKAGTMALDTTAAFTKFFADSAGREATIENGCSYLVSLGFTAKSGAKYLGKSKIKAKNAASINTMIKGTSCIGTTIDEIEIDGNKANDGCAYGIWFVDGSYNFVKDSVNVHDTIQAGAVLEGESGSFVAGRYIDCGKNVGTDNHGIMLISTTTTSSAFGARNARVSRAYRKGITAYTAIGASIKHLRITGAVVDTCGVASGSGGGIYIANQPTATDQESAVVSDNICYDNYVNFEFANVKKISGSGNISSGSVAQGVVLVGATDGNLPGFVISDSGTHGLDVQSSSNVVFGAVNIRRSNRSTAGYAAGLRLLDSSYCSFGAGSSIYDETPKQTHGIVEEGTSDYNYLDGIAVVGATSALWTIIGANTSWRSRSGKFNGIGEGTPLNTLHIGGGITLKEQALVLANGANQNVTLPSNAGYLVSATPTLAYSIGGIAGGHAGRKLTIVNYTGVAMTLNHQDGGSTAANRFTLASSANYVVPTLGSVDLVYSSTLGAWTKIG